MAARRRDHWVGDAATPVHLTGLLWGLNRDVCKCWGAHREFQPDAGQAS